MITFVFDILWRQTDRHLRTINLKSNFCLFILFDISLYQVQAAENFDKTFLVENSCVRELVHVFKTVLKMVDNKVDMNSDGDSYNSLTTNDPKNVQELTQYVSLNLFN